MNITKVMLSIIIGVAVATSADAANTMCVTDDMEQVILDPSIQGTRYGRIEEEKTWWVDFDYGRVSGIARCNSTSGTYARAYPEHNFDNYPVGTTVTNNSYVYCWCKMTSPVRSAWVYRRENSSASECASDCAFYCGYDVQYYSTIRGGMFGSAGM